MKRVQKCFSVLLAVILLLTAAPLSGFVGLEWPELNLPEWNLPDFDFNFSADAAEVVNFGTCGENLTWTLDRDGVLTISGTGAMNNYTWPNIPWYSNLAAIKTAIIENGVTSIGYTAFSGCTSLTAVTIPDSVTSIGSYAFNNCSSLTVVTIPDSVTSIEWGAFRNCSSLTSVTIGDSVTSIGDSAFYNCTSLTSVTIGDSVTSIGKYAFENCTSLTSVTIGDSVTNIGNWAFEGCTSLTAVHISDIAAWCNIDFNGSYANPLSYTNPLYYAHNLYQNGKLVTELTIPDSVTSIGDSAFSDCTSLTSVTIPDSVTSIGNFAFYYCNSLTSITIPDSVTSIGIYAFSGCDSLTAVHISDIAAWCNINFSDSIGDYDSNPLLQAHNLYLNGTLVTELTIPDSVTSIGEYAFRGCTSLTSVTIGDSVTSIRNYAFYGCTSLTSVTIGNSVTSIEDGAFYDCTSLSDITVDFDNTAYCSEDGVLFNKKKTELIQYPIGNERTSYAIPSSVTSILGRAFSDCTSLTSITIPSSVTYFESYYAFYGCTSLTAVHISDIAAWCNIDFAFNDYKYAYIYNPLYYAHNLYLNGTLVTELIIPDSVTSIGRSAFSGCTSLTSATIPDSVTSIGKWAFEDCTSLTSVTIGNSVTRIGEYAFSDCTSLTSVTIPDSVTRIWDWAFDGCTSLTDVYYSGSEEQWAKISIGSYNTPLTNATIHYNSADKYTMKIKGNNGATNSVAKGEEVTFYVYLLKNGEYVPCKNNYAFSFDNPGVFEAVSVGRNNDCFAVKLKAQNIGSTNMTISDDESGAKITIQLRSNMPLNAATFDDVKEQGTFYEHGSYHYWNYYYDYNGLYVNNFSYLKSDNNYYVNMNVFNEKAHYGAVVSYDKDGNVADYKLINQMDKLPTSLWDGLFDSFDLTNAWLGKGLPGEYLYVNGTLAKETPIRDLKVPEGGYLVISNNCVANEFVFLANVLDITIDCSLAISKIPCSETNEAAKNVIEDILNNFLPDALGKLSTDVITNLIKELSFNNIGDVLVELSKEFEKADIDLWKILKDSINAEFGFSLAEGIAFQMLGLDFIADIFGYTNTMIKMFDINCSQKAPQIAIYAPASSSTSRTSNGITVSSASSMNSSYVLHTYLLNDSSRKMSQAKPTIESISKNYEMYDISLYKKGETAQPETEIEIFIPIPAGMNKNRVQVYWYKDDGTLESMNAEVRGSYAVFKTNHLSYYIICEQLAPMFVMGDVDNNGEIEAADARLALRAAVKLETLTEAQTQAADADKNGKLEAADARLILRAAVGLGTL